MKGFLIILWLFQNFCVPLHPNIKSSARKGDSPTELSSPKTWRHYKPASRSNRVYHSRTPKG